MALSQKVVLDYLSKLSERRDIEQAPWAPGKIFSIANPHKCDHCQANVINRDLITSKGSFRLSYGAVSAISAAKAGCAFYEWLLEFWAQYSVELNVEEYGAINFGLLFRPRQAIEGANITIEAVYSDGRRKEIICWPNPQLIVCTTQGEQSEVT